MWNWVRGWFKPKQKLQPPPQQPVRRKVTTEQIRARLQGLGWTLMERPVCHSHPDPAKRTIGQWKLVANKAEKSYEIGGPTLDEAMQNLGKLLGVIPK
jgi:hypothetical protein